MPLYLISTNNQQVNVCTFGSLIYLHYLIFSAICSLPHFFYLWTCPRYYLGQVFNLL